MQGKDTSLNSTALSATLHCLTGCAIGEVLGMVIGTALGGGNVATITLAVVLAFFFGYSLTMLPLLRSGLALATVLQLAFDSDTLSITPSWRAWTTPSCWSYPALWRLGSRAPCSGAAWRSRWRPPAWRRSR